jgi:predicted enzyme related to lactoylglutathione lyase
MKLTISMIILFVKDINNLKKFYTENLQLELEEEIPSQWVVLSAGSCQIGLHQIGPGYLATAANESNCESNTKIVFELDEDISSVRARLVKDNIQVREIKSFDNYPYLLCDGEDPEGNVFQLRQNKW